MRGLGHILRRTVVVDVCVCDTCGEVLLLLLGYADAMLDGGDAMRKSARNAHVCVHTPYRSIKVIGRAVISASFC